mmetsp:Transcript_20545/g.51087  ORF Transcript_20545/g.51087 Transcript_20545/m.51087 type:complete len:439 (-) Transcript_20545:90-1406(-)
MEKPTINVVVIGNVDSGKSTTAGHLLCKFGRFNEQKIAEFEVEADKCQKRYSKYAWVFDRLVGEHNHGITTNFSRQSFESSKFKFNIIDTPGLPDSIEDMITGTSQADVGLLVVDSSVGGYESGIGSNGLTKEHCLIAYTLGVKQMIVAVNKMDDDTVNFSEDRWKIIRSDIAAYLKKVGYKPMKIPFVPISGWQGDNLDSKSMYLPWYGGPTLVEALDNLSCPKRPIGRPLRVPIHGVLNEDGVGVVLSGRIESGELKPGMKINIAPPGILCVVKSLHIDFQAVLRAIPGDIVRINIDDRCNGLKDIQPGHVISNYDVCPAKAVSSFEAQIIVMNHPGKIYNGCNPMIDCHTSHTPCTFTKIKEKLDQRTGKTLVENPDSVQTGDVCIIKVEPRRPLCVEQFKDFPALGRFAVRDLGRTVAVGVVKTTIFGPADEES